MSHVLCQITTDLLDNTEAKVSDTIHHICEADNFRQTRNLI
jgi:hypothetical protein